FRRKIRAGEAQKPEQKSARARCVARRRRAGRRGWQLRRADPSARRLGHRSMSTWWSRAAPHERPTIRDVSSPALSAAAGTASGSGAERLLPGIGDAPDRAVGVVGDKERAVLGDGERGGPAKHLGAVL